MSDKLDCLTNFSSLPGKTFKMFVATLDKGDMERMQLGINPMWMMDRERKDELPQMQVEFIDRVCTPLYTILSESFPWVKPLLDGALANRYKYSTYSD